MDISLCKEQLDLFSSSPMSLFTFLNCCRTKPGSKLLKSWIEAPLTSAPLINSRLDMVEYFGANGQLRANLMDKLRKLPPVFQSLKRFKNQISKPPNLENCVMLSRYAQSVLEITNLLKSHKYFSREFEQFTPNLENLINLISSSIDTSSNSLESEYKVKPDFDESLQCINKDLQKVNEEIEDLRINLSKLLSLTKELETVPADSHILLFEGNKLEVHSGMRLNTQIPISIVSHLQRNVKMTCPDLKTLAKSRKELIDSYLTSQISVEQRIIEIVKGYTEFITSVEDTCSFLDCIIAISHACFTSVGTYTRPIINNSAQIRIKNCRHPSAELHQFFVPNSIDLIKNDSSFLLITGPNMGGKSTFLKQIGICVILAHIGSFVPAEYASICIVDKIMARMGASDNQLDGQSTFMCEMNELAEIVDNATGDSLLLIDEIGRGTSTSEGLGIAWGTCEILSELGCFTLFATHFSELSELSIKNFKACQMEVRVENGVEMTYRVVPGAAQFSFGIEIAAMYDMPAKITETANSIKKASEDLQ